MSELTNNDLLKQIADNTAGGGGGGQVNSIVAGDNITVDDTDLANPIVSATGGGGGGGLDSPLSSNTVFELDGNNLLFKSEENNGSFSIMSHGVDGVDFTRFDLTDNGIVIRGGGTAGGEGDEYKTSFTLGNNFVSFGAQGTGQLNIGGGIYTLGNGEILADAYTEFRNDSGTTPPKNFLYTDASGQFKSAPAFPSGATGSRPTGQEIGYQYFDTTLSKPVWYNGSGWVDAMGEVA